MKAMIAAIAGLLLAGHVSEAEAEADCTTFKTFTVEDLVECSNKWRDGTSPIPEITDDTAANALFNYSHSDITRARTSLTALADTIANLAQEKDDHSKEKKASTYAKALLKAANARHNVTATALKDTHCDQDLVLCLDRDGKTYSDDENTTPFLLPRDEFVVRVLSNAPGDADAVTLTVSNVRRIDTLLPHQSSPQRDGSKAVPPSVIKQVKAVVADDSAYLEILCGPKDNPSRYRIPIQSRLHYVEFGLMLPFAYQREVTPQGAVLYGMEPDLAFTITVFLGARSDSDPLQPKVRSWFGLMAGADLTNQVSDKRYYLGLDFSPVSGLALNAGLAILPWEYVPNPEQVPDVLTGDIEPDQRYRASFFFGARMTPEVFDTVKAAYKALNQ